MNIGSLRKRLERVEKILKPRIEAAAAATVPAPELSREAEERHMLGLLWFLSGGSRFTAEDKAELERLRALYPDEYEDLTRPRSHEELTRGMKEMRELFEKGEWK